MCHEKGVQMRLVLLPKAFVHRPESLKDSGKRFAGNLRLRDIGKCPCAAQTVVGLCPLFPFSGTMAMRLLTAFSSARLRSRLALASAASFPPERLTRFDPSRHSR